MFLKAPVDELKNAHSFRPPYGGWKESKLTEAHVRSVCKSHPLKTQLRMTPYFIENNRIETSPSFPSSTLHGLQIHQESKALEIVDPDSELRSEKSDVLKIDSCGNQIEKNDNFPKRETEISEERTKEVCIELKDEATAKTVLIPKKDVTVNNLLLNCSPSSNVVSQPEK